MNANENNRDDVGRVPSHGGNVNGVPDAGSGDPAYNKMGHIAVGPVPSPGETVPHTAFVGATAEETTANAGANREFLEKAMAAT